MYVVPDVVCRVVAMAWIRGITRYLLLPNATKMAVEKIRLLSFMLPRTPGGRGWSNEKILCL